MYKTIIRGVGGYLPVLFGLPFLFVLGPVQAFEFDDSGLQGNIDTTLSYGISNRVQSRDKDIICTANGGTAYGCNADDGNLNYDRTQLTNVMKFTSDIEINHKSRDIGAFFRVKGFVDHQNDDSGDGVRTALPDDTLDLIGDDLKMLDAYGWARFDLGGRSAEVRVGSHVLNWGESTFIQGGNNAINPIDAAAIRLPGAELREALLPVPMISLSTDLSDNVSIEGFYQLGWKKTIPDPSGSYFSTNDFATDGGSQVQLGFGSFSDLGRAAGATFTTSFIEGGVPSASAATLAGGVDTTVNIDVGGGTYLADNDFLDVDRTGDDKPKDSGQWGISLRYFSEKLNDTEFGFYYMNYHSRLPLISANTGTAAGVTAGATAIGAIAGASNTRTLLVANLGAAAGAATTLAVAGAVGTSIYADTASYVVEYPEDIKLFGVSFNTNLGLWAVQGEYSHKRDVPLQIDDVELLLAALTPLSTAVTSLPYATNQVGVFGASTYIPGYIKRNVSQVQATATKIFSNVMGADQFVFVAEAAVTHVHNMPSKNTLRLNGPGTFTSGNTCQATSGTDACRPGTTTGAHAGKDAEDSDHFADATSWGYRLAGRWTINNAYKAVNLQPRFAYQHDVDGITPGPGGNFIEGRKALTLGLGANYKNQWSADVAYTSFFGAGRHNLINDRDFFAFNLKYSF